MQQMQQDPQQQYNPQQQQEGLEPDALRNLIVNYIPIDLDESNVSSIFEPFGEIESIKIITDRSTGQSRGYGFVKYKQSASAQAAIQKLNGYEVGTKRLKVGLAAEGNQSRGGYNNNRGFQNYNNQPRGGGGFYGQQGGYPQQHQQRMPQQYMQGPPGAPMGGNYGGYPPQQGYPQQGGYPPQQK
ncbi:RNA-binding protein, UPB1 [Angomonas deanei]|uniref:RNA recognition motif. (A.k.a. RRM, RBD, or RNP domain), putative n=1 Tax=Angomonas deanei TaxID=59799 RepID=A0A7G2CBJ0_9TRYP|nr:RNA-binding protein, UPB1 [Angomonas deanei]CAD2217176.1 RNA recognition motif. (a.k.a. RRM, RBD, or RNP domain), putative [Angomonas deanei]|eukprot:EPY24051.1 RNA-binding protein, UPB1 [Angomonas deanei]